MLLCLCVVALMLLCRIYIRFLDVIEPLILALMLLCPCIVALMLLCILYRTFGIGTDVIVPMCSCTDVTVQDIH